MPQTPSAKTQRVQLGLLYVTFAGFCFGISIQQILLDLYLLLALGLGLSLGHRSFPLLLKERRAALVLLVVTSICTAIAYPHFPSDQPLRIHWALAAIWLISPTIVAQLNWHTLYRTLMICSIPGLLYSLYWLGRPDEVRWAIQEGWHVYPRAFGLGSNPITYGSGLVVLGGWTIARLICRVGSLTERRLATIHLALCILIELFSRVRSGLLGFLILFVLAIYLSPRLRKYGTLALVTMLLSFAAITAVFGFNTASLQERVELLDSSIELFEDYPIFGIGPNKYKRTFEAHGTLPHHPHNTLMGMATEHGIFGLLAYLGFVISMVFLLRNLWRRHGELGNPYRWVVLAFCFEFTLFNILGLFDYNYSDSELLIMHALHWSLATGLHSINPSVSKEPQP